MLLQFTISHRIMRTAMCAVLTIIIGLTSVITQAATTNPSMKDSDGDGFVDGPDVLELVNGEWYWQIGEDKNANGQYEPDGWDGIRGTLDDETDPSNEVSHPVCKARISYIQISENHDYDGDGLSDYAEDGNLDAVFGPDDESDWQDADTDDDGLSDGFEALLAPRIMLPFFRANDPTYTSRLKPNDPDSDHDGLPDGFELGVGIDPVSGIPVTWNVGVQDDEEIIPMKNPYVSRADTNTHATFSFNGQERLCFMPSTTRGSILDPMNKDSNYDSIEDGVTASIRDGSISGFEDPLPWIGFVSDAILGEPATHVDKPVNIQPVLRIAKDGTKTWDGFGQDTESLYFIYQSRDDTFGEQSTDAIKFDMPPPRRSIPLGLNAGYALNNATPPILISIERCITGKRIWLVRLRFTPAFDYGSKQKPKKVWISEESPSNRLAKTTGSVVPVINMSVQGYIELEDYR